MSPIIPSTPVPDLGEISDNEPGSESPHVFTTAKAFYTPGVMAKTAAFTSPLALFQRESSRKTKSYDFADDSETEGSIVSQRLGISRPAYGVSDDDTSIDSHRIGISRPSYEVPEGDIPISPLNLYLEKKNSSPTPTLVEIEDDESEAMDVPWNFNLMQSSPLLEPHHEHVDEEKEEIDDGYDRIVHKHTSEGHYLLNSAPLDAPMEGMRYSLTHGKNAMSSYMRAASDSRLTPRTRPLMSRTMSAPIPPPSDDSAVFKIFLLLIQPKSKIFELIQVIYAPSKTTIGGILEMIPANATEPALGSQAYAGLCRPKDGNEITEINQMASSHNSEAECAKICLGEILVAIPVGYSGEQCATISKPILTNPKIVKLLKKSDPLAPKRRKSSSSIRRNSSRRARDGISVVETVKEEEEEFSVESKDRRVEMKRAIEHAALAAAAANAEVSSDSAINRETKNDQSDSDFPVEDDRRGKPIASIDVPLPLKRADSNAEDMMDRSLSSLPSQSDSIRSSLTFQSHSKRIPRKTTRRRHRRNKRKTYMLRMAAAALVFMVGRFVTDVEHGENPMEAALGLLGLLQGLIIFLGLVKMQKMFAMKGEPSDKCPAMRFTNNVIESYHSMISNPIPDMS
jgi:hypothetical protein